MRLLPLTALSFLALLLLLLTLAQAQPATPRGTPYAEARARLIAAGWQPLRFPDQTRETRCFNRDAICRAYPETESCAGTGFAPCLFVFRGPRGAFREIVTSGEALAALRVFRTGVPNASTAALYRRTPLAP